MWEDWTYGFYDNLSGSNKQHKIEKVIEMFNSKELTTKYMTKVIEEWRYSCEQNFSNESLNKIAYLGQAACCLYSEIPATITMEAWSLLDKSVQERSNSIALKIIKKWEFNNKHIQLCLNII
jgi:hypothetical protein